MPRLELVAGNMAVNLVVNVRNRPFIANRVNKMKSQQNVLWRHVPTSDNPAYLRSREDQ